LKILVADDETVSRMMMKKILQTSGYEVVEAADGREAAGLLSEPGGPRMALIDWIMPAMDGPQVCRQIRTQSDHSYIYLILLTSKQSKEDIVAGLESGADDYLTKPCNPEELKARLRTGQRILDLEDKLVEAREAMRYKATHDSLTSLWNHGAILALLKRELSRMQRENSRISLLLCDIDHFKQINDTYGHIVGDKVLEELATRLQAAIRPYDAVGRYGGEEFLLILTGCDKPDLQVRAEQIRQAICSKPFTTGEIEISISISIGALPHCALEGTKKVEEILSTVDAALYRAKAAGRNCVVFVE
jgi:diguanylate cyclase (GGDEF)-like protein